MRKVVLAALAVAGLLGSVAPAMACEGGKCKMEHADKDGGKTKKGKRAAAKMESCHMSKATANTTAKSCCSKTDTAKEEAAKNVKQAQ